MEQVLVTIGIAIFILSFIVAVCISATVIHFEYWLRKNSVEVIEN